MHQDNQLMFRNHSSSIHNLEVHMGQLANTFFTRNQGTLLSNTEKNPKEYVKTITLRSEKSYNHLRGVITFKRRRKRLKNKKMSGLKYK